MKGGKGSYSVEQEWYPDTAEGSWPGPEPNWYGVSQPPGAATGTWVDPSEQEQPMLNLGMPDASWEPSGWQFPPSRRTFRPCYPSTCNMILDEASSGRFEALRRDDNSQQCIMMMTPDPADAGEHQYASFICTPPPQLANLSDDGSTGAGGDSAARWGTTGGDSAARRGATSPGGQQFPSAPSIAAGA